MKTPCPACGKHLNLNNFITVEFTEISDIALNKDKLVGEGTPAVGSVITCSHCAEVIEIAPGPVLKQASLDAMLKLPAQTIKALTMFQEAVRFKNSNNSKSPAQKKFFRHIAHCQQCYHGWELTIKAHYDKGPKPGKSNFCQKGLALTLEGFRETKHFWRPHLRS